MCVFVYGVHIQTGSARVTQRERERETEKETERDRERQTVRDIDGACLWFRIHGLPSLIFLL